MAAKVKQNLERGVLSSNLNSCQVSLTRQENATAGEVAQTAQHLSSLSQRETGGSMNRTIRCALAAVFAITAALAARSSAHATTEQWYSFNISCTHTNAANVATGSAQLFVRVSEGPGANQATFHFINTGPNASSITDVYFDDGSLLGIASITDSGAGVNFSQGASPPDLPGGNGCDPDFHTVAAFTADSNPPTQPNGVNTPTEYLDITFSLQGGQTFDDVVAELSTGALRIGIHVQAFGNGGSESFINGPSTAVDLASFGAQAGHGQVTLQWRTGSEVNNAGFNLYRATSASGQRVKVNDGLIAAKGNEASGSSYSTQDVPGYGGFYYWLEDVDYTGLSTLHGPVQVAVRASVQRPLYRPSVPGTSR